MNKATLSIIASTVIAAGLIGAPSAFGDRTTSPFTDHSANTVDVSPGDHQLVGSLGDMNRTIPQITNDSLVDRSYSNNFNIPAGYGWVKITLKNRGAGSFTFNVRHGDIDGTLMMSGVVPADGKEHPFYSAHPLPTGWVNIHLDSNPKMKGTINVEIGNSLSELKNK